MQDEAARGGHKGGQHSQDTLIDISDPPANQTKKRKDEGETSRQSENIDSISLSSDESMPGIIRRQVPGINCPEKIILCIDLSPEMNEASFNSRTAPERTAYQFTRKASQMFVKNKAYLNPCHEYGIIVLEDEASWYQQFESNPDTVCTVLDHLTPIEKDTKETFDMESLFQAIQGRIVLPELEDPHLPPPYIVRVVMVYGRSLCQPNITSQALQILRGLMQSPYFFFDVLYVHQMPSENNKCESIYDAFCELDEDEVGYMLEVSRSTTRLFDHMAALLAHPLQRPKQRDTYYMLASRDHQENR